MYAQQGRLRTASLALQIGVGACTVGGRRPKASPNPGANNMAPHLRWSVTKAKSQGMPMDSVDRHARSHERNDLQVLRHDGITRPTPQQATRWRLTRATDSRAHISSKQCRRGAHNNGECLITVNDVRPRWLDTLCTSSSREPSKPAEEHRHTSRAIQCEYLDMPARPRENDAIADQARHA